MKKNISGKQENPQEENSLDVFKGNGLDLQLN